MKISQVTLVVAGKFRPPNSLAIYALNKDAENAGLENAAK